MNSSGSKKITIAGIGLGAIVGTPLPADNQSVVAYCIKIGAIATITLTAILVQTFLDRNEINNHSAKGN